MTSSIVAWHSAEDVRSGSLRPGGGVPGRPRAELDVVSVWLPAAVDS
jgi:hypothetical protein